MEGCAIPACTCVPLPNRCQDADTTFVIPAAGGTFHGTTSGPSVVDTLPDACDHVDPWGPEVVYALTAPAAADAPGRDLKIETTPKDLVTYVVPAWTTGPSYTCTDAAHAAQCGGGLSPASFTLPADGGAKYYIVLDGKDGYAGPYTLKVSWEPTLCNDGTREDGEQCDPSASPNGCPNGETCSMDCTCPPAYCGNGVIDPGEECDDGPGNGQPGDCCSATCTFEPASTVCRPAVGVCDVAETCTGTSGTCPPDAKLLGDVCRPGLGDCDPQELCNGVNDDCPADVHAPVGTACVDGNPCTEEDSCGGDGTCIPGTLVCDAHADPLLQKNRVQGVLVECDSLKGKTCEAAATLATVGPSFAAADATTPLVTARRANFGHKHSVKLKLKLTNAGKRQLAAKGQLDLQVQVTINARQGKKYALQRLVKLVH
jgi:cysteine-rich repeat protein